MDIKKTIKYPEMALIKQKLCSAAVRDIPALVQSTLLNLLDIKKTKNGQSVAVAVGSRGIDKIDLVLLHLLKFLKSKNLKPFIIPAMGSHGGATKEGQKALLAKLGITESSMNVPIVPDMETVSIGMLACGTNIHFPKKALEADHIIAVNRVKPHTKFKADIESGLCKMLTVGLGKAEGAYEFHCSAVNNTFKIIEDAAKMVMENCNILLGIALLEDGHGSLSHIEAIEKSSIIDREKKLLKDAYRMMGRIPLDNIDILIIDFIGKDISGIGMDSNVTGRHRDITGDFYTAPNVKRIFVRDLSPDSDGNGNGIGLADVTTKRLVDALDIEKTYINALTAISLEKAAIPINFDTDKKALNACLSSTGLCSPKNARIVRIRDTKNLEVIQVSKAFEDEILSNQDIETVTPWRPVKFDEKENLTDLF